MAVPVESDAYKAAVASPELKMTSAVMMAAARHLAEACATPNAAFVKYDHLAGSALLPLTLGTF